MAERRKSKKGDLPVTILVIGIFAVCAFALLTFFISDFNISNALNIGAGTVSHVGSEMDQYLFYRSNGMSQTDLNSLFNVTTEYGRQYLVESQSETQGAFLGIIGGSKVVVFSVKYQIPSSAFLSG